MPAGDRVTTLVIGAGLTGLTAALSAGAGARVLEAEGGPGGCLRTDETGPYRIDRTGHLFHMTAPAVMRVLDAGDPIDWVVHPRDARVLAQGCLLPYPIQYNLFGLPEKTIEECIAGVAGATPIGGRGTAFDLWAKSNFGDGLWSLFFEPYNRKLWRFDLGEMTADWTGRFVPGPDLERMREGAAAPRGRDGSGYNGTFQYPRTGGSQVIPDRLASRLDDVRYGAQVRSIRWRERSVELDDGSVERYETLVSTAPLDALVRMLAPAVPELETAAGRLAHTSIGYVAFAGPMPVPAWHWVYLADESLVPFRLGNLGAYGDGLAPSGEALVCVERSFAGHGASETSDEELIASARPVLARAPLGLRPEALRPVHVGRLDPAYVVFTAERSKAVRTIRRWALEQGIASTGRYGAWTYGSAGDAILQGAAAGRWSRSRR